MEEVVGSSPIASTEHKRRRHKSLRRLSLCGWSGAWPALTRRLTRPVLGTRRSTLGVRAIPSLPKANGEFAFASQEIAFW